MKKLLVTAALAVAAVGAASAQKMAIGVNLGPAPCLEDWAGTNFQLGAKFQYNFTSSVRGQIDFNYGFESKGVSVFDLTANVHYVVPVASKFSIYPLAGLGYGNINAGESFSRFVFNVGLGGEIAVARNFGINVEFKYQYMADYQRFPILFGFNYKF